VRVQAQTLLQQVQAAAAVLVLLVKQETIRAARVVQQVLAALVVQV
jgi:hypothetical protein